MNVIDPYTIQLGLTNPLSSTPFTAVPLNGDPWANGNNMLLHAPLLISSVTFSGFQNLAGNGGNDQFILENGEASPEPWTAAPASAASTIRHFPRR